MPDESVTATAAHALRTAALFALAVGCANPPSPQPADGAPQPIVDATARAAPLEAPGPDAALPPAPPLPKRPLSMGARPAPWSAPAITQGDFVGASACKTCHAEAYTRWAASTHGQAGGLPSKDTVIPRFRGVTLRFSDARVRLEQKGGEYAFVIKARGEPPRRMRVDAVIGSGRIHGGATQVYFHRRADGKLMMLPFDYSVTAKKWFCQTRSARNWAVIDGTYSIYQCTWPPVRHLGLGGGNNCQNCHGSQIALGFDREAHKYETMFTSLNINCESCHGPGRRHVEVMGAGSPADGDIGLRPLALLDRDQSIAVCLACHADKATMAAGYLPGEETADYFAFNPIRSLSGHPLTPNGMASVFTYQENHRYSDCALSGSMTCVDCHGPHDLAYRDVHGRPLPGRFDDGQCLGCHEAKRDAPGHGGHAEGPKAPTCTDCHLPLRQHPGVGAEIPYRRGDHRIASPKLSEEGRLGGLSACRLCHTKQTADALTTKALYGGLLKPSAPISWALAGSQAPNGQPRPGAERALLGALGATPDGHPLRVRGLSRLMELWAMGTRLDPPPEGRATLRGMAESGDLETQAAALAALMAIPAPPDERTWAWRVIRRADGPTSGALRRKIGFNLIALGGLLGGRNPELSDRLLRLIGHDARALMKDDGFVMSFLASSLMAAGFPRLATDALRLAQAAPRFKAVVAPLTQSGSIATLGARIGRGLEANAPNLARRMYESALRADPNDYTAHEGLCRVLVSQRAHQAALECVARARAVEPHGPELDLLAAQIHRALGDPKRERVQLERVLRSQPDRPDALERLRVLKRGGR